MNIADSFIEFAKAHPHKRAFIIPQGDTEEIITYKQFYDMVSRYREGLVNSGHRRGDRVILLMPINLEFYAFMMAVISLGLVAVFLDPGIGVKKLLVAIADSKAKTIISVHKFLKLRFLLPMLWGKKLYSVDSQGLGLKPFSNLKSGKVKDFTATSLNEDDHYLITFTSGSTGRSKGSDRNVENVFNQINAIKKLWPSDSEQVDFSSFLMFGFMNLCFGVTTVLPPMNFAKVGELDEKRALELIRKYKVSRLSGSSAFLSKISKHLVEKNEVVESILYTAQGGSPVSEEFCANMEKAFPKAQNLVVYGSTEVAPISVASMRDVKNAKKEGALVGKPLAELTVKIVRLPASIPSFDKDESTPYEVSQGEWGEVIIKGPHVVKGYVDNPQASLSNKIQTPQGEVWHRTGDVGHFDEAGNLWITGRLSELVEVSGVTFRPYVVEAQINTLKNVKRSALINTKRGPVLVIEEEDKVSL
ncbi:MAG: AMP-binding protein, partial [Bacteriovoracaceae bacterium]